MAVNWSDTHQILDDLHFPEMIYKNLGVHYTLENLITISSSQWKETATNQEAFQSQTTNLFAIL